MGVLFLTEGGNSYGRGHITRCIAISKALTECSIASFYIIDAPENYADIKLYKTTYFDWKSDWDRLSAEIDCLIKTDKLKAIFVDSYYMSESLLKKLDRLQLPLFILDDQGQYDYPQGILINPTMSATKECYKIDRQTDTYIGVEYTPLREPFWDIEPFPQNQREGILVTLGGSDTRETLQNILYNLADCNEGVTVLTGGLHLDEIRGISVITYLVDEWQMKDYISKSRVIVCAGGGTLLESACCGTPAVVVKVADNQGYNIKASADLGFARYAGEAANKNIGQQVYKEIKAFDDNDIWCKASLAGRTAVDGLGAKRIARIVADKVRITPKKYLIKESFEFGSIKAKNFLTCNEIEHQEIIAARNSDNIRKNSLSQSLLTVEEHNNFIIKLKSSETAGYWRIYEDDKVLGVISLTCIDLSSGVAVLGYYKDPKCSRGRVGKLIIQISAMIAFNILRLSKIIAESFDNNITSVKSMQSAGFIFTGSCERVIDGKSEKISQYELVSWEAK